MTKSVQFTAEYYSDPNYILIVNMWSIICKFECYKVVWLWQETSFLQRIRYAHNEKDISVKTYFIEKDHA